MDGQLNSVEIAKLSAELVERLASNECDVGIKIAALRTAADAMTQAVQIASFTAMLQNTLGPRR